MSQQIISSHNLHRLRIYSDLSHSRMKNIIRDIIYKYANIAIAVYYSSATVAAVLATAVRCRARLIHTDDSL